ncbi:MAG: uracil-DNA glycosylase [Planctomycetes bacterium]|nr:uracil-DNA glycosylase [Planctomycetota bacterium]
MSKSENQDRNVQCRLSHPADGLDKLITAARQVIETELALGGDVIVAGTNPLPEVTLKAGSAEVAAGGQENLTPQQKTELLAELEKEVASCNTCGLWKGRTNPVFGMGDPDSRIMFVGEGPGAEEDAQGLPFVGRSGQLLTGMIEAMGLTRNKVYIANVVKCRPPGNRIPTPEEAAACWGYLKRQIEIVRPEAIVVLGNAAARNLLETRVGISKLRGQWHQLWGIPVMPTFHPAYVLRQYSVENRKRVWSDLQAVMEKLGLKKD